MDDVLVHGKTKEVHDQCVKQVLWKLKEAGMTLIDKCHFSHSQINFLGHIISAKGIIADQEKIKAFTAFPTPKNVSDLQCLNGMVNQ